MTTLHTVGHGTLAQDRFAAVLREASIARLVDVRSHPGSRRNPQFGRAAMEQWVPAAGVSYRWEPRLGGRRRVRDGSPNVALRHSGFRAYADHMAAEEFGEALGQVLAEAADEATAVMCAESVWWRCHRRLLADATVLVREVEVLHLMHDGSLRRHQLTEGARLGDGVVVYDVGATRPLLGEEG